MSCYRGTTNRNARGNTAQRRKRRRYLVEHYRADVDLGPDGTEVPVGEGRAACRCYRCGELLTEDTVTADRRTPGIEGGTYDDLNIRPACMHCNASTGGALGNARKAGSR